MWRRLAIEHFYNYRGVCSHLGDFNDKVKYRRVLYHIVLYHIVCNKEKLIPEFTPPNALADERDRKMDIT